MNILQLTTHFSPNVGGVETHLSDLVSALIKRNHQVFVLTYQPLITKTKWKMYESEKNLHILRIPWFPGFFYKLVKTPLIEFIYLFPGLFLAAPFVIVFNNSEIIHTHGLVAGFVGVFWGKILGKKVITTTHSIYHFPERGIYKEFVNWIFSYSDHVLTLSKQSEKEIVSLGVPREKVSTFTYWIDLNKFKSQKSIFKIRKLWGWEKKFLVLFVGRLVEEKGIIPLLKALEIWDKNIDLIIIGTGPLEAEIKKYASKYKNFLFLGKIDNDKLPEYYSASDVTIVPSVHEEGFGRIILESLACGMPVIGSNRGAIPEAMDESVGRLIDVTPENIKKTVEYFYKNPDKLQKLSKNTRKFAEKRYSEKNIIKILNAYKD